MKEFSRTYYLSAGECNPQGELPMPLLLTRIIDIATHHANAWGVGYAHLIQNRQAWVLSRVAVEMRRMPRVDEHYTIITWIEDYNTYYSLRDFEVQDEWGETIGYARTIWMVINLESRTGVDIASLAYIRENVCSRPCPIAPQERLRPLPDGQDRPYQFRYVDCDFNRHVNTVRYLELLMNQFDWQHFESYWLRRLELAFVKETRYGDAAIVRFRKTGDAQDWQANIMVDGADHVRARLVFAPREK